MDKAYFQSSSISQKSIFLCRAICYIVLKVRPHNFCLLVDPLIMCLHWRFSMWLLSYKDDTHEAMAHMGGWGCDHNHMRTIHTIVYKQPCNDHWYNWVYHILLYIHLMYWGIHHVMITGTKWNNSNVATFSTSELVLYIWNHPRKKMFMNFGSFM